MLFEFTVFIEPFCMFLQNFCESTFKMNAPSVSQYHSKLNTRANLNNIYVTGGINYMKG